MTKVSKLLEKLDAAIESLKDHNKFMHLFSKDPAKKELARLRETLQDIKLKVKMSNLKEVGFPEGRPIKENGETGEFVKIRPCAKEYQDKTYLGIMIGDGALSSSIAIKEKKLVCSWAHFNPAILIPDIKKVIYGAGSWWSLIESEDDLKKISNLDIENVWYVKALKQLEETK